MAVPSRTGLSTGIRRLLQPLAAGPARRPGVERPPVQRRAGAPARDVRRDLRQYWEDPSFESYDPARDGDRLQEALSTPSEAAHATSRSRSPTLDVRRSATSRRSSTSSPPSGPSTTTGGTSSSWRPVPGKTVVSALDYQRLQRRGHSRHPCSSSPTGRSCSTRAGPPSATCCATVTSANSSSAANVRRNGGTCSRPSSRSRRSISTELRARRVRHGHRRRVPPRRGGRPTVGCSSTSSRRCSSASRPRRNAADGSDIRRLVRRADRSASCGSGTRSTRDCSRRFSTSAFTTTSDLSELTWKRGRGYDVAELTNVYTGNDAVSASCCKRFYDKVADPRRMRALGFCVSIEHAEFMAATVQRGGIPSMACHGDDARRGTRGGTGGTPRSASQRALHRRPVQRGHRPARGRHGAVPAPDRERDGVPAAAWAAVCGLSDGQGLPHGARLHRRHSTAVPLRPPLPRADRERPAAGCSGTSSRASRPCRPAATSSSTGWRSRSCWRTSGSR